MEEEKIFPVDYTSDEIKYRIKELLEKVNKGFLTGEEKHRIEQEILLCQNHLVTLLNIESNENLKSQQVTLANILTKFIEAEKGATKQTRLIIFLTLITLLITAGLEVYHIREDSHNQHEIIDLSKKNNFEIEKFENEVHQFLTDTSHTKKLTNTKPTSEP